MTRIFDDTGNSFPVTIMKLEENQVVKVLDQNKMVILQFKLEQVNQNKKYK